MPLSQRANQGRTSLVELDFLLANVAKREEEEEEEEKEEEEEEEEQEEEEEEETKSENL